MVLDPSPPPLALDIITHKGCPDPVLIFNFNLNLNFDLNFNVDFDLNFDSDFDLCFAVLFGQSAFNTDTHKGYPNPVLIFNLNLNLNFDLNVYALRYICIYALKYICIYIYICMYIYIYLFCVGRSAVDIVRYSEV